MLPVTVIQAYMYSNLKFPESVQCITNILDIVLGLFEKHGNLGRWMNFHFSRLMVMMLTFFLTVIKVWGIA